MHMAAAEGRASLAEKLNHFVHFEVESLETASSHPLAQSSHTLRGMAYPAVNPRKVPWMSSDLCRLPNFCSFRS